MLSFIYRLVRDFEKEHGMTPNLLYLNRTHMTVLHDQIGSSVQHDELVKLLGMEIIITQEALHPHVARVQMAWQRQAV